MEPASYINNDATKGGPIGAKLAGDLLSDAEKLVWKNKSGDLLEKNEEDFKGRLREVTQSLCHFMPWMRMRVHFGRVCLGQCEAAFRKSQYNFDKYSKMMKNPRLSGTLDRK